MPTIGEKTRVIWLIGEDPAIESLAQESFHKPAFQLMVFPSIGSTDLDFPDALMLAPGLDEFHFNALRERPQMANGLDHAVPVIQFTNGSGSGIIDSEFFQKEIRIHLTPSVTPTALRDVVLGLIGISERFHKNLSAEIRRSEFRYRDMLENANDFIFMLDENGLFQYLNNRFTPMTGFAKELWIGRPFLDLIDPVFHETARVHYEMAQQGRARVFEVCVLSKGEPPILSLGFTPLFDHGQIVGSMGIGRDVTEKKRMEKELLELKNFNESIIQSMEAGLLTLDLTGRFTSLNAGGERIVEWKEKEVIGKSLVSILKIEKPDLIVAQNHDSRELTSRREIEITVKSGRRISVGFTTTDRLDNNGHPVGTIISFRDITQLKQMQSEVMRMDRLASLGVLASGIAHEIKNPLAGIKTMAQACEEEIDPDDSRREYLTRIIRQVNRLDDLLKTFFAYAKPKQPDRRPVPVKDILFEVMPLVGKKISTLGIQYQENLPPDIPPVFVDSPQMQQVFLNLILNALHAMPQGGTLKVEAYPVDLRPPGYVIKFQDRRIDHMPFVEIRIQDTGTGILPEHLETIFDPFFTTKSDGLGLGLSIVHRIVNENHGVIRVESTLNQGTCFIITLPAGVIG